MARKGAPAADISREGRAGQGRAAARGKFLIITEIKLMSKPHNFTYKCEWHYCHTLVECPIAMQLHGSHRETAKETRLLLFPNGHRAVAKQTSVPHQGLEAWPCVFSQEDLVGLQGPG